MNTSELAGMLSSCVLTSGMKCGMKFTDEIYSEVQNLM